MAQVIQTLVAVTNAAYVAINASTFARYVEIAEDGAAIGGLKVKWNNGTITTYTAAQQPIKIGNTPLAASALVGVPADANNGRSATQYCQIESVGANSNVRVTEYC